MTEDEDDGSPMWPPMPFGQQFQNAGEDAVEQQMELFKRFMSGSTGGGFDGFSQLGAMSMGTAMFKTRVQSGGRISIPDAEREALDIEDGDIVQTIVIPVKQNSE
ncbi:AbrB/MazE/SpoVT family DNA-binding domain-containing protein [Haloplanus halobius]|uniref:AbrB/MazE/SpoVT family DNA-binding domain-containing protein n=1 Tax=Haloplanus halobius TaxID=2934938 RepID=UPI00200CE638|nr:AbrB/MazE/SpoVT family DNA-binding domain-containing protein [Haloplanus sp. XH21]